MLDKIIDAIPPATIILANSRLHRPRLLIAMLYDMLFIYGFDEIVSSDYVQPAEIGEQDRKDRKLMMLVWLCLFIDCDPGVAKKVVIILKKLIVLLTSF